MKYHEKLNLKSPIFKYNNSATARTPSKSPIKPAVNTSDLFQKVCCPNCKYGFKIIRQELIKQNPSQNVTQTTKKNKIRQQKEIETQTEGILTQSNNNSLTKSMVSQHKFSKTYDFSMMQNSNQYELSQLNEILQPKNIEDRQLKQSQFKFKPLSLSPHSKFAKSKNILKTLDTKRFQIQENQPITKTPSKTAEFTNPYHVPKQQSCSKKEENLYQQTLPFRQEQNLYNNNSKEKQYSNGGNIEKEPIGYGNSNVRGNEGGLVSPHASSEKLEENHMRDGVMEKNRILDTPKSKYQKSPQMQAKNQNQNRGISNSQHKMNQSTHNRQSPQQQQSVKMVQVSAEPCCKCKDSSQFQDLITYIVMKNQQSEQVIKQLQQFCKQAGEQIEMPSFCKMLALSE